MRFRCTHEFHDWFLSTVTIHCETLDEAAAAIDDSIIDDWIIPLTEWNPEIVHAVNKQTVIYWYLLQLLYLYGNDTEPVVDYYYDEIYQFLDRLVLGYAEKGAF